MAPRVAGVLVLVWLAGALARAQPPAALASPPLAPRDGALFHHLHLIASRSAFMADFYWRLFPSRAVERGTFWKAEGVMGDGVFLLLSGVENQTRRHDQASAIWHFGWGKVSVGETYKDHLINEVNWKPPYASLTADWHIHLRSGDPAATADWYEAVLSGTREARTTPARVGRSVADAAAEGLAEAIVTFDKVRLIVHRTAAHLVSTRDAGGTDHVAFLVPDIAGVTARARDAGLRIVEPRYRLEGGPAQVMLEGPDGIVIELIERPKGPAFWEPPR